MNENKSTPDIHSALKEVDRQVGRAVERLGDAPSVEPKGWASRFERYRKEFEMPSEPSNYIHVGLESACQYSDLIQDISSLLASQRKELIEQGKEAEERAYHKGFYEGTKIHGDYNSKLP